MLISCHRACCAEATEINTDDHDNREYPVSIKIAQVRDISAKLKQPSSWRTAQGWLSHFCPAAAQVFVTGGTLLIFFAVLYYSLMAWAWLLSLFGTYQVRSTAA